MCHWASHEEGVGWLAKRRNLIGSMAGKHLVCLQCDTSRLIRFDSGRVDQIATANTVDLLLNQICKEELES